MSLFRLVAMLGLAFSIGVLVISYAAIAVYTSTPWLWSMIVHESGDRTLLQTILYYEHAARELPLDLILGAAIGGSALFVFPGSEGARHSRRIKFLGLGTLATMAAILGGTFWTGGLRMLYDNLLQFPTRPGEPLVWGGHWRYHFLSHVTLMLVSFGLAAPLMLAAGRSKGNSRGLLTFGVALGVFLVLTLLFVPGAESFRDPVFLGHQVREAFTHTLVTVPMAWSVCILLARLQWHQPTAGTAPVALSFLAGVAGVILGLFLIVGSLATSAASQGQSDSIAVLIFPHFFEHTFSYVVTTLSAGLVFELGRAADQPA